MSGSGTGAPVSTGTAWHYTTKQLVQDLAQIPQADLKDEWIEWVEYLIDWWTNTNYRGTQTYTNEMYDGDATTFLFPKHSPIISVSKLTIGMADYSAADYKIYPRFIELVNNTMTEVANSLYRPSLFPVGQGNILISYVGGNTAAGMPANIELCATQMVSAIAMVARREGSDFSLKYSRVSKEDGDKTTITESFGLQKVLMNLLKEYIPRRWKMR